MGEDKCEGKRQTRKRQAWTTSDMDRCTVPYCKKPMVITTPEGRLCEKHWEEHCNTMYEKLLKGEIIAKTL